MKKYFLTGLIMLLPITITAIVVFLALDLLTAPFAGIVHKILTVLGQNFTYLKNQKTLLTLISRVILLGFLFIITVILGYFGRKFLKTFFYHTIDRVMLKIPLVKKIYKAVSDVVKVFFSEQKKAFEASTIVPFPYEGCYAMGLQSKDAPHSLLKHAGVDIEKYHYKSVFIPTSPHPISGFLVMMKIDDIHKVDVTTEDVFKYLISAGLYRPGDTEKPHDETL